MSAPSSTAVDVPMDVVERVRRHRATIGRHLDDAVARRERAYRELSTSEDPVDQAVAVVYRDFLLQVEEVVRSRASLLLAADEGGDTLVGRVGVFDDERDLVLMPWHAPEGQRLLTSRGRLLVTDRADGEVAIHRLTADERALARRIRGRMRAAAGREEMADPLATLTREQGAVLSRIAELAVADRDVLLTGPPGSGKSAIAIVELARRILTHPARHDLRVLFVTGTPRLAARAEALGRMLGVASITPVPQARLLRALGVADVDTPVAGRAGDADAAALPVAIERTFAELRDRLATDVSLPHPLGATSSADVAAVRTVRAAAATSPYAVSAGTLRRLLVEEYETILPGARSVERALAAADVLRPVVTPTELVRRAAPEVRLPRPLRAAAVALARELLESAPRRRDRAWDLVVVDEYQRLPGVVLALLRHDTDQLLLSGDPQQAFTPHDLATSVPDLEPLTLTSSLRMPSAVGDWLDRWWSQHGLEPPAIACAVDGGTVVEVADVPPAPLPAGTQVIAAGSVARRRTDEGAAWLSPLDALGLEWGHVVLVDPERIRAEHGDAGLFVAATRAIDRLTVVAS